MDGIQVSHSQLPDPYLLKNTPPGHRLAAIIRMLIIFLLVSAPVSAVEDGRPYHLVCFEKKPLLKSLNKIESMRQLFQYDTSLRNGSCDYAQFPPGSVARIDSFHNSTKGFIFPVIKVEYGSTKQKMLSIDGIFPAKDWSYLPKCGEQNNELAEPCILPKNCDVLEALTKNTDRSLPFFMKVPKRCQSYPIP